MVGDELLHRDCRRIEQGRGIEAEQQHENNERDEDADLAPVHVRDGLEFGVLHHAEDHAAVEIERVGGRQDHAGRGEEGDPGIGAEGAEQRQELADETAGARQADVGHGEQHEDHGIDRHALDEAVVEGDLARVHAVVDDADTQEERARDEAVRDHLEDRAVDALHVEREDAHGHEAHVGDRGVGDQLLHVLLREGDERGVDDRHHGKREDERGKIHARLREHRY